MLIYVIMGMTNFSRELRFTGLPDKNRRLLISFQV